jgi:tetratricopeptide (TPR) repeat protein
MEQRTKRDIALINLVAEFEAKYELGAIEYLEEKKLYQLIAYYEEEHQLDKALDVVDLALDQFSYRSDFYILKARILLFMHSIDECIEVLDHAHVIAPFETEIVLLRARALSFLGQKHEALILLENIRNKSLKSDLSEILICESYIYEDMKDYEMMYEVLKESLHLNPKNEEALERMMVCTELSRKYEESVYFLEELLDIEPYSYLAWFNLGHAYLYLGDYEKAFEAMEFSYIINEDFENGYLDCADICVINKDFIKAYNIYKNANEKFGPDCEFLTHMASCKLKLGNFSKARYLLSKAIRLDQYNDEAYFLLGECFSKEQKWYSAINAYHKAINLEADCDLYYFHLALAYVEVQDYTKATFNFNKATKIGHEQSEYWAEYVTFLMKLGLFHESLAILDEAEEYTFGADLLYCRALTYYHIGKKKEAIDCFEEALLEDYNLHEKFIKITPEIQFDEQIKSMVLFYKGEIEEG